MGTSEALATMQERASKTKELQMHIHIMGRKLRATKHTTVKLNLLGARADANLELAHLLKSIPAADSERWALNGLDPTDLATLALKDAEEGLEVAPPGDSSFSRRVGEAQMLLEQYAAAKASFLEALRIDGNDSAAASGASAAESALAADSHWHGDDGVPPESPTLPAACPPKRLKTRAVEEPGSSDALECSLCMRLLWEPVATPCAHLFCRTCFERSCDYSNKCPSCRTVLHVGRTIPVLSQLRTYLVAAYPKEYAERDAEESTYASAASPEELPLPLFVMAHMLPGETMRLHIFEPRYRLLVRRAMAGSRRLGMAAHANHGSIAPFAVECEITECHPLADGRFYLELKGLRRFRVGRLEELDGYRVAIPQFMKDEEVPLGTTDAAELMDVMRDVESRADIWCRRLGMVRAPGLSERLNELLGRAGPKPAPEVEGRAEKLGFWVACLLPLSSDRLHQLLETTSSLARLQAVQEELGNFEQPERCAVS